MLVTTFAGLLMPELFFPLSSLLKNHMPKAALVAASNMILPIVPNLASCQLLIITYCDRQMAGAEAIHHHSFCRPNSTHAAINKAAANNQKMPVSLDMGWVSPLAGKRNQARAKPSRWMMPCDAINIINISFIPVFLYQSTGFAPGLKMTAVKLKINGDHIGGYGQGCK